MSKESEVTKESGVISARLLFLFNGVASLFGWNAVLTSMDYFQDIFKEDVYLWLPVPIFISYIVNAIFFNEISKRITIRFRVMIGLIATCLCLLIMFLLTLNVDDQNRFLRFLNFSQVFLSYARFFADFIGLYKTMKVGYILIRQDPIYFGDFSRMKVTYKIWKGRRFDYSGNVQIKDRFMLCEVVSLMIGLGNGMTQMTFFATINYMDREVVTWFTIGTAVSGLSITMIRGLLLLIYGSNSSEQVPIVIYFSLAIGFLILDVLFNESFFKSQRFLEDVKPFSVSRGDRNQSSNPLVETTNQAEGETNPELSFGGYLSFLYQASKVTWPYPHILVINYIITFLLFPSLTVAKTFEWSAAYSSLLFILFYNIGDTVGKTIIDYRRTFNAESTLYVLGSRAYFMVMITVLSWNREDPLINNNFYPFFTQFMFAVTNGFATNAAFVFIFEKAPQKYKGYGGVLGGICIQLGIVLGTFLAIPYQKIVQ